MLQDPYEESPTTALERLWVVALGESIAPESNVGDLKRFFMNVIGPTWGPPSRRQLEMAERWGLFVDPEASQQQAGETLLDFMLCRAWVFSVLRRQQNAHWKIYPTAVVPDETVSAIAIELLGDPQLYRDIRSRKPSTKFQGDVWYRFGPESKDIPAYRFVADRLCLEAERS